MSWDYRVLENEGELAVYEVYYNNDRSVKGHSLSPTFPKGSDIEELQEDLNRYSEALLKPVLEYKQS